MSMLATISGTNPNPNPNPNLNPNHRVHVGHDQRDARPLAPRVLELERALQLDLAARSAVWWCIICPCLVGRSGGVRVWWGAVWWVRPGRVRLCGMRSGGMLSGGRGAGRSRDARVRGAARVCQVKGSRLRARAGEQRTCACPERRRGVRARLAVVARARYTACGRRAQVHGCMFQGCAHTCARDDSSLRFGRSSTSLKSSFVSSSMRSACARPLAERPDTPSTPPATACRRESRRRNAAISPELAQQTSIQNVTTEHDRPRLGGVRFYRTPGQTRGIWALKALRATE